MQYRQGTCGVTNGSDTVTITGSVSGAENVQAGDAFKLDIDGAPIYQIASRTPSSGPTLTGVTLTVPYAGTTDSGQGYQITSDFTPNRSYPLLAQGDADAADWLAKAFRMLDEDVHAGLAAQAPPFEFGDLLVNTDAGEMYDLDISAAMVLDRTSAVGTDLQLTHAYEAIPFNSGSANALGSVTLKVRSSVNGDLTGQNWLLLSLYSESGGKPGSPITMLAPAASRYLRGYNTATSYRLFQWYVGATLTPGTNYWLVLQVSWPNGTVTLDSTTGSNSHAYSADGSTWTLTNSSCYLAVKGKTYSAITADSENLTPIIGTSVSRPGLIGNSTTGDGVEGYSTYQFGVAGFGTYRAGVYGQSDNQYGIYGLGLKLAGIYGRCDDPANTTEPGVFGQALYGGPGVVGEARSGDGVAGYTESGTGVRGQANAGGVGVDGFSESGVGVFGHSASNYGVQGSSTDLAGVAGSSTNSHGVSGSAANAGKAGVFGINDTAGSYGVQGVSANGTGVAGNSSGAGIGVSGVCDNAAGVGVQGASANGIAVKGFSDAGIGVSGVSTSSIGVQGISDSGIGINGSSTSGNGGYFQSTSSVGVAGESSSGIGGYFTSSSNAGVQGLSATGKGGVFSSRQQAGIDIEQTGTLTANNSAPVAIIGRYLTLSGFTADGPMLYLEDATAGSGRLIQAIKQSVDYFVVDNVGTLFTRLRTSAPDDSELSNSMLAMWLDEGSNNLMFKMKTSGGTVKAGTLAVT